MGHHAQTSLSGEVTDIFAHRFVVKTAAGTVLADLGPKGAELVALRRGDQVELVGEMKPSELKVSRIARQGGKPIEIVPHTKPHEGKHEREADPEIAIRAARDAGFKVYGAPKRRPKHFEVLGRKPEGAYVELHVELDGKLRHAKPIADGEPKWASEMTAAS